MPVPILMPALSPTMEEGTLAKWHVAEGDSVSAGDIIAEIETDKATMEVEAVDEGVIGKLLVAEGTEGVKVNAEIAILLEDGEDASLVENRPAANATPEATTGVKGNSNADPIPATGNDAPPKANASVSNDAVSADVKATPLARRMAAQSGLDIATLGATAPGGKVGKADVLAALGSDSGASSHTATPSNESSSKGDRIFASPLARNLAKQASIDLGTIEGSGPNGRITKIDIERVQKDGPDIKMAEPAESVSPKPDDQAQGASEIVKHSGVRKVIAQRLTEADRDVPQFYLTIDCEIDVLLAARKQINAALDGEGKISVNDLVIKAAAQATRKHPALNAQWTDDGMRMLTSVDVSVAVAYDGGLITPIIFDADKKGLAQISVEMRDLAERGRNGKLAPNEYQGGSMSVSNLGMYRIKEFTAIINPPQSCILAVGAGEQRAVVKDGKIEIATIMSCTLTCDHRVVDGALGAQWMNTFRGYIEAPATMLI